jgi:exopolyphosphatase/guanosine-5'-triphosphate,3'-diphosphate pyrophosphatase
LDYNVEIAAEALRKKGLPESFAQMLLRGVSLDTIIKEDQIKKDSRFQDCKDMTKASVDFSKKHRSDSDHYLQVRKIALMILDGSTSIHELGAREKCWLECAAILHDIGLSKSGRGHQKKSYRLILNDSQLPFTSEERRIIASITRFHRKALPKQNDKILVAFNHETIHKIMILAGILRIADSLDYSHQSIVEGLNIRVEIKRIILECISKTKSVLEEQAFNKKKDLFEKVFAKKMVLIWKEPSKTLDM